jgi:hypothetical protein
MPHPLLGLPPSDVTAGQPAVAALLRRNRERVAPLALQAALRLDPTYRDRFDDLSLRTALRDLDGYIEQLARAIETGEERFVVWYAEWIVPVYRRRGIRMNDVVTLLRGLEEAALSVVPSGEAGPLRGLIEVWVEQFRRHRRLPGDHKGNWLARLIWKGAGLGDDTVV